MLLYVSSFFSTLFFTVLAQHTHPREQLLHANFKLLFTLENNFHTHNPLKNYPLIHLFCFLEFSLRK